MKKPTSASLTLLTITAGAALALTGCGNKPPGCADEATVGVIKSILVDNTQQAMDHFEKDDTRKIIPGYLQSVKVSLQNVVSDGYDDTAKKNRCKANLAVETPTGTKFASDTAYTTQKTEDKDGGFVVQLGNAQGYINSIKDDLLPYYLRKRYIGEWQGTYSCKGLDGATDGPRGPFSMPVALVVDNNLQGKMERTTAGGGIEVMTTQIGRDFEFGERKLGLKGEGKNNPDDTWQTRFDGTVNGMDFKAAGKLLNENQVLRECAIKLTLPTN